MILLYYQYDFRKKKYCHNSGGIDNGIFNQIHETRTIPHIDYIDFRNLESLW